MQKTKKTVLRIHKADLKNDIGCYMIFEGKSELPEIDSNKYWFTFWLNPIDCDISLCWMEK